MAQALRNDMADKTKPEAETTEAADQATEATEAKVEAGKCVHNWKYIKELGEPTGSYHNQRCTICGAERRSNNLT